MFIKHLSLCFFYIAFQVVDFRNLCTFVDDLKDAALRSCEVIKWRERGTMRPWQMQFHLNPLTIDVDYLSFLMFHQAP